MMRIVEAIIRDVEKITRIYNQNLGTASMYLTPRTSDFFIDIINKLDDNERFFVLRDHDKIIGWSLIQKYSSKEGYRYTCETSTYIDNKYQGQGYGTHLKKEIIHQCEILGYRYILARIVTANDISIKYNLKLGYSIVGVQHGIGNVNGKSIDVTIMEYHILNKPKKDQ